MSSSDLAISVRNLTKAYTISHKAADRHVTLAETILDRVRHPFRRQPTETFQALKGVSFEVREGEIVGIIGRNGAGKSTLLKVLSRITEPTGGEIELHGRIGSLLEVGTGFHPELTGRENVYLNGRILGMRKKEIDRQFDAIVDFAEIERFLDTPVKRYSSGMYVRLAFAVAAHLDPEILIIDEVLAVGDVSFQKKCLGKIGDVSAKGRTVLFVSHSMPTILNLCSRAVLLDSGTVVADGDSISVTREYLARGAERAAERVWRRPDAAPGDRVARLHAVRARDALGVISETFDVSEEFEVEVQYWNLQHELKPTVSIHFYNEDGVLLFVSNDFSNAEWWESPRTPGLVTARCAVPAYLLAEGRISVLAALCTYDPDTIHAIERDAIVFQVVDRHDIERTRDKYGKGWPGAVRPRLKWQVTTDHDAGRAALDDVSAPASAPAAPR